MIEFNLGLPGSGKTYKSVYALYANFGLNEKFRDKKLIFPDIDFAYSNINELKLDCFRPDSVSDTTKTIINIIRGVAK